jgi:methyl-accepting chemotaxis protein
MVTRRDPKPRFGPRRWSFVTKEIKVLVGSSVLLIRDSAAHASDVRDTMTKVELTIKQISDVIEEIGRKS